MYCLIPKWVPPNYPKNTRRNPSPSSAWGIDRMCSVGEVTTSSPEHLRWPLGSRLHHSVPHITARWQESISLSCLITFVRALQQALDLSVVFSIFFFFPCYGCSRKWLGEWGPVAQQPSGFPSFPVSTAPSSACPVSHTYVISLAPVTSSQVFLIPLLSHSW